MTNSPHLPFSWLADLVEGRLSDEEKSKSLAHLSSCALCSDLVSRLESAVNLMRTDASESAPERAIAAAVKLFRPRALESQSRLKRLLATLKFDSFERAPAFGLRAGASAERQLLFSAGSNDIQLQIAPASEGWTLSGQVLGPCSGGRAELNGQAQTAEAELNEMCEFAFPPVLDGEYALILRLPDVELEISPLKLGA